MIYEVTLQHIPGGFAANSAEAGEEVRIIQRDFASDSDGQRFYNYLNFMQNMFLRPFVEAGNNPYAIELCLVLIGRDSKASVHINELPLVLEVIPKRNFQKGEGVGKDDLAAVIGLKFAQMEIPKDCGIVFFFSIHWKRGIFFDFRPANDDIELVDIYKILGSLYNDLLFQDEHFSTGYDWERTYALGWFPFLALPSELSMMLFSRIEEGRPIETAEEKIIQFFDDARLLGLLDKYVNHGNLRPYIDFIQTGIEAYLDGNFIASINSIWPVIARLIRDMFASGDRKESLEDLLGRMKEIIENERFLPSTYFSNQFREYLSLYYFKNFDPINGIMDEAIYDVKNALIGILVIDQLYYFLSLKIGKKQ